MEFTILIDSREKVNGHITKELDGFKIPWRVQKLDFGDYSMVSDEVSYENQIVIERKGSLDELIGNFTVGRERFRKEFERSAGCKIILMVEASMLQLEAGQYRSRMSPTDLKSFLKTWCNKFQLELKFVDKKESANFILDSFKKFYKERV
jgi:ERCC4-type nuclease